MGLVVDRLKSFRQRPCSSFIQIALFFIDHLEEVTFNGEVLSTWQ